MRSQRFLLGSLLSLALTAVLLGCRPSTPLCEYHSVDPRGWSTLDTLRFQLRADSASTQRTVSLGVRFTERVEYRGLWLVVEQRGQAITHRDTMYLELAGKDGRWYVPGAVYHEMRAECTTLQTPAGQPLELLLYHIMPEQNILGFTEAGVMVK